MISHNEAQTLISARQDQVLDPIVEHELNAHLATCDSCRAFAQSTEQLTMGLRALPYLPASPAVRRAVLDRVEEGRSPWGRLAGAFNTAPGPAPC
jgi:predicted anti-sigma-YlaC factor YlaD